MNLTNELGNLWLAPKTSQNDSQEGLFMKIIIQSLLNGPIIDTCESCYLFTCCFEATADHDQASCMNSLHAELPEAAIWASLSDKIFQKALDYF